MIVTHPRKQLPKDMARTKNLLYLPSPHSIFPLAPVALKVTEACAKRRVQTVVVASYCPGPVGAPSLGSNSSGTCVNQENQ